MKKIIPLILCLLGCYVEPDKSIKYLIKVPMGRSSDTYVSYSELKRQGDCIIFTGTNNYLGDKMGEKTICGTYVITKP